jgi:hypothetical protein
MGTPPAAVLEAQAATGIQKERSASKPARQADTIPMQTSVEAPIEHREEKPTPEAIPARAPEPLDDDLEVEIITEEVMPIGRRAKKSAQYAVRAEAAVRFHRDRDGEGDQPKVPVLVDNQLLEEARGPERNRDTIEIRNRRDLPIMIPEPEAPSHSMRRSRLGRVLLSILVLLVLFMIAALTSAAVARWLAVREAASVQPDHPAEIAPADQSP